MDKENLANLPVYKIYKGYCELTDAIPAAVLTLATILDMKVMWTMTAREDKK